MDGAPFKRLLQRQPFWHGPSLSQMPCGHRPHHHCGSRRWRSRGEAASKALVSTEILIDLCRVYNTFNVQGHLTSAHGTLRAAAVTAWREGSHGCPKSTKQEFPRSSFDTVTVPKWCAGEWTAAREAIQAQNAREKGGA
jgi:hypothetical protein